MITVDGVRVHVAEVQVTRTYRRKDLNVPGQPLSLGYGQGHTQYDITGWTGDEPEFTGGRVTVTGDGEIPDGDYVLVKAKATRRPGLLWEVKLTLIPYVEDRWILLG